jgi:hypothetical protein
MDRDREQQILREYESVLEASERDVFELRNVIDLLRKRLGVSDAPRSASGRTTYGGRPNIPTVLNEILSDGKAQHIDAIYRAVTEHSAFREKPPSRGSVANRLAQMAAAGELERPEAGSYMLAVGARAARDQSRIDFGSQNGGPKE